jgi:hypothetical protein
MCAAGAEALHVFVLAINPAVILVGDEVSMAEVIRQAAAAHHYPAVFDDHTEEALYLGRRRRLPPKRNESCSTPRTAVTAMTAIERSARPSLARSPR